MTADQSINYFAHKYPELYTGTSFDIIKFKHFNHFFNTTGNGFPDVSSLIEEFTINEKNKNFIDSFPSKYITDQPLFKVFTKLEERSEFPIPDYNSALPGLYTSEEISLIKDYALSRQVNKSNSHSNPYPNFKKDYSILWKGMHGLDKSWYEAAFWFYSECKTYFSSENVYGYHSAAPHESDLQKWSSLISDYERNFKMHGDASDPDFFSKISQAYQVSFNGDIRQFIKDRWSKELERIQEFLDQSIIYSKSMIEKDSEIVRLPEIGENSISKIKKIK